MAEAVFIDRDGVINVDYGYVHRVEDFEFIPGSVQALKRLSRSDYNIIVITDQSGIGKGYYTKDDLVAVHAYMEQELDKQGIKVDAIYYCDHAPEDNCDCRKPKVKNLEKAARDFSLDLSRCWLIGDKTRDIQTGKNAGCRTILVMTGKGGSDKDFEVRPDVVAKDLKEAVGRILGPGGT
jgi:D,D-heptose 1,7-bisphosphate phosphatase